MIAKQIAVRASLCIIAAMVDLSSQERDMLALAMTKAQRLVDELSKQQAELEQSPPDLPPEKLAQGKMAFENALASARRSLKALEEAAAMVEPDPNRN
jgi:hypothetical protein